MYFIKQIEDFLSVNTNPFASKFGNVVVHFGRIFKKKNVAKEVYIDR
jgi:hypothetical protein